MESGGRDSELVMTTALGTITIRRVSGTNYVKITMGKTETGWSTPEYSEGMGSPSRIDPARMYNTIDTATQVQWLDDDTVSGVIDAAMSMNQLGADITQSEAMAGRKFPIEASFDTAGRLVEYKQLPTAEMPTLVTTVTFSDFGAPIRIEQPTT